MAQRINKEFLKQWSKFMFSFYDYLPTKYEASQNEWKVRKLVWDFKDGKRSLQVAEIVARKLREQFGADTENIVFACIPASSEEANTVRYKEFSAEVCRLSGTVNAFSAITIEGARLAIHENKCSKRVEKVEIIKFNQVFFNGKKVIVFDDILTRGFSYARFACELESFGAVILGGLFLGRTLMR